MVATGKNRAGNSAGGIAASRAHPAEVVTSGDYDLPAPSEQVAACQYMSFTTLGEVFANRAELTKKQARGAGMVFRGVGVHMRTLEYGQRE